ncbi:MAG: hypothetical protein RR405_01310 [Clostridia bacterium]
MKSTFMVLIGREMKSSFSLKKIKIKQIDWLGLFLDVIIIAGLGSAFVIIFKGMIENYTAVSFVDSALSAAEQRLSRQVEFMTVCYAIVVLAGILFGISKINKSLVFNTDMENLLRLPISSQELFLSKLTALYFNEAIFVSGIILPINITFGIVAEQSVWYWFATVFICVLLPMLPLLIAAIFALPANFVINKLKTKYAIVLILFVASIGALFFLYSKVLVLIEGYFISGQIKYVFNERTTKLIISLANCAYPVNWYAKVVFAGRIDLNLLYGVLTTLACVPLVYFVTQSLFKNCISYGASKKTVYNKKTKFFNQKPFTALLWKEFITVFRTPDYTFSYFATALVLPLMVYCSIGLLTQLIFRMLGMTFNFEIALLVITMFAVLTNTFCASNISRDGSMFMLGKTLPSSFKEIIWSKLVFCSIINVISIVSTCMVLFFTKYINVAEFFIILPIVLLVTTGEIFMATRKDLNKPKFIIGSNTSESSRSASFVIIIGLLISLLLGVTAIGLTFFLSTKYSTEYAKAVVLPVLYAIATLYCAMSAGVLFVGLNKKMEETIN